MNDRATRLKDDMSTPDITQHQGDAAGGGLPVGRIVAGVMVAALVIWTVVRVRTAQTERARVIAAGNEAAEAAKKERKDKPLTVRQGVAATWHPVVHIEGTLAAAEEADLAFKVSGRVHSVRAKVGDYVKHGQVLATLDQSESAAQLDQARAAVRVAESQLNLAMDTEQRTATLVNSGAGSQQQGLQTKEQRSLAAAQLEGAKAAVALAQANLESSQLLAPFSGFVTKAPSGAGQVVNPMAMTGTLFHLQNTSELRLVGTVSEADAGLIHVGEALRVNGPDGVVTGTVTAVLGSVDPATRRVPIEARVPNDPKHPLLAGSYVRAEVEGKQPIPVLSFPAGVIRPGSQNEVMVVENGRLAARAVVFHPAPDGMIFVRAGLDANDHVVVDPSPEAKDGDQAPVLSIAKP
jgi:membrane fusion protein (multidrug efflux system)